MPYVPIGTFTKEGNGFASLPFPQKRGRERADGCRSMRGLAHRRRARRVVRKGWRADHVVRPAGDRAVKAQCRSPVLSCERVSATQAEWHPYIQTKVRPNHQIRVAKDATRSALRLDGAPHSEKPCPVRQPDFARPQVAVAVAAE
jgi:hypothetical protein